MTTRLLNTHRAWAIALGALLAAASLDASAGAATGVPRRNEANALPPADVAGLSIVEFDVKLRLKLNAFTATPPRLLD